MVRAAPHSTVKQVRAVTAGIEGSVPGGRTTPVDYRGGVSTAADMDTISLDAMLDDLRTLVEIESPSLDLDALQASAEALAAMIERHLGRPADLIDSPAGPHVHWSGGGEPKVLLLGHHDTVFPIGALAARPFTVAGGRVTGPGVFDMLAGIVQALHGLAALDDLSGVETAVQRRRGGRLRPRHVS